ncbi:MAG: iron-sulfur cluster assembly protein [Firmicutes bacterium]|nr:iron-sulfur cluster assembly protein [Bacillota bacterium]
MITEDAVINVLKEVVDPELGVNIIDLGLIYKIDIQEGGLVNAQMTLTAPGCPLYDTMARTAEMAMESLEGVKEAHVEIVWDPPWTPECMTEEGRRLLGF